MVWLGSDGGGNGGLERRHIERTTHTQNKVGVDTLTPRDSCAHFGGVCGVDAVSMGI
jgi:hypothetical protein